MTFWTVEVSLLSVADSGGDVVTYMFANVVPIPLI